MWDSRSGARTTESIWPAGGPRGTPLFWEEGDVELNGGDGRDVRVRDRAAQGARGSGLLGDLVRPVSDDRNDTRSAGVGIRRKGQGGEGRRRLQSADGDALQRPVHPEHPVLQGREARGYGRRRRAEVTPRAQVRRARVRGWGAKGAKGAEGAEGASGSAPLAPSAPLALTLETVNHPQPGRLHLVSTPIGNLGDISLRAIETLRGVTAILAEDTRHSRHLLARHGITTPVEAYHEHNEARQ